MCLIGVGLLMLPPSAEADEPGRYYIPPQTAYEDQVFTLDLSAFACEYWHNESQGNLTYFDDSPLVETDPETGLLVWDHPDSTHVGEHYVTVTVVDELGRSDQWEIKITVVHVCTLPWWPAFPVQRLTQGVPFRLDASLRLEPYCAEHCYPDMTYTNDHQELFVIDAWTGTIEFTPCNEEVGNWSVTVQAGADSGFLDSVTIELVVGNVNDPPRLGPLHKQVMTEGEPFQVQLQALDPDLGPRLVDPDVAVDPDERLTFGGGLPGWEVDPVSGVFTYIPTNDDARGRTLPVTFNVTDAYGEVDSLVVVFRVLNVEQPPRAEIEGLVEGQKWDRNQKVELTGIARDEWGEPWGAQYLWYLDGEYLGEGETFTWKPPYDGNGPVTLRLVVVNATNHRVETRLNVTLTHPDYPGPDFHVIGFGAGLALLVGAISMTATLIVRRRGYLQGSR